MLSAINFPYPVVPIVRHHHENWNGTGYPTGIRGTDIPIGARILSVVDCFDALTSDRPYRPRLSDEAALAILIERRGSMYDPLVVDTFIRVYKDIAPQECTAVDHQGASKSPRNSAARVNEEQPSIGAADNLGGDKIGVDAFDASIRRLRAQFTFELAIGFIYDANDDELVARHFHGEQSQIFSGLRIGLGERLSGWVAANKKTILNSDPALDLGELSNRISPRLLASLSVALTSPEGLIGVLALYTSAASFPEESRRLAEVQASKLAAELLDRRSPRLKPSRDPITGLPMADELPRLLADLRASRPTAAQYSLVFVEAINATELASRLGRSAADQALIRIAESVESAITRDDLLFRREGDEFVVLVAHSESNDLWALAKNIRESVKQASLNLDANSKVTLHVSTHAISLPEEQGALKELLGAKHATSMLVSEERKSTRVH
jgi:diguanylate cyclase (GGDEF)-like protein